MTNIVNYSYHTFKGCGGPERYQMLTVKDYELEHLNYSWNSLLQWWLVTKLCVVSLGVTLRMVVELDSNSNIIIEIVSKTKHVIN